MHAARGCGENRVMSLIHQRFEGVMETYSFLFDIVGTSDIRYSIQLKASQYAALLLRIINQFDAS